jgi:ABC-type Na+ transport system ATPase subunit NatA
LEHTARHIADEGRPLVWVTHDLDQCERLSDETVVLIAGRVALGESREKFLAGEVQE